MLIEKSASFSIDLNVKEEEEKKEEREIVTKSFLEPPCEFIPAVKNACKDP